MDWKNFWNNVVRKYILNKYVLVLVTFGVIILFVGEQSVLRGLQRSRRIHEVEKQLEIVNQDIQRSQHHIETLQSVDSLERFAREHYYMHAENEDVYLVDE
ncbi:MAG: septum formation initiator family protein [Paludibacteraceae bacterium]|nr:septum formation initiator family protein [Paludibacteraceae bacterium]